MAALPAAGPRLLRELLDDWAWGNLSAANVVRYCRAAAAPGPRSCAGRPPSKALGLRARVKSRGCLRPTSRPASKVGPAQCGA